MRQETGYNKKMTRARAPQSQGLSYCRVQNEYTTGED